MPARVVKGLIALNDADRLDDARRRLLADWCRLVAGRLRGDGRAIPTAGVNEAAEAAVAVETAPSASGPAGRPAGRPAASAGPLPAAGAVLPAAGAASSAGPLPAAVTALGLPPRVSQVLTGLLAGAAEKQIARDLGLSPHTVHVYVKQLYKRLNVNSRGELLARFVTLN